MHTSTTPHSNAAKLTAKAQYALDFAAGVLGAAGHELTDPVGKALLLQVVNEEISGDEAIARYKEKLIK